MDADKPFVSVLMSVYNEDTEYIKESIESILNQSYTNFEFIILGDNPTNDRVSSLVTDYSMKDERIHFVQNEINIGLTKSLNKGLGLCKGKYVVRMDGDDISLPNRIECQVSYMENHPSIKAAGANVYFINEKGEEIGKSNVYTNDVQVKTALLFQSSIIHPSVIIRLAGNKLIKYDEHYRYSQDYALWVSLLCDKENLCNLPSYLLKYRLSSNQITSSKRGEQLQYTKEIQKKAQAFYNVFLEDKDNELLFRLIYDINSLEVSEQNRIKNLLIDFQKEFISRFNRLSINVCRKQLADYYVRYLTKTSTGVFNTIVDYLIYCAQTKFFGVQSSILLLKLLISSR